MGDGREEKQWSSLVWIGLIIATTFLLYACNKTNEKVLKEDHLTDEANKNTVVNDEPITLSIGWYQGDEYWDEFVQDLGEEFPHITIERVDGQPRDRENLEEWILGGKIPDILSLTTNEFSLFTELELAYDLTSLLEESSYDLTRFMEGNIDHIQMFSINNGIQALPFQSPRNVMYYNKDIFDMVGEPYPEVGLTWPEAVELARKLTIERDGVQYRGLDIGDAFLGQFMTLDTPVLDPETHESQISTNPVWRLALEYVADIYTIPGNFTGKDHFYWYSNWDAFVKDQVVAMTPHPFSSDALKEANEAFTNWGITTIPEFEDYPGVAGGGAWTYGISNTSEHKEAAFEVLKFLLADEQLVKYYSIFGDISRFPLDSPSLREEVEPDPIFENVDYDILFAQEFAAPIARSEFENEINRNGIFVDLVKSDLDVNTFIRETEEKITSIVADLKGKK
ncbi:ABC transporter substrate-binding protein [Lederbergia galactosidilytica]|uniref:Extracellular solute-binding protein n=1 Tax=Lederbergia galactosidilytica TaxID=217031 RepID=A0A177ZV76_9BACI|nr:extracellular solute-binding protein [Lederbergia galactosidilytica]OAK71399.1 hypothetical protein ABB05_10520 [Lederbergia galactosidilytica]